MDDEILFGKKERKWLVPLGVVGGILLAVLLFFGLFYITKVEVVGNTQYSNADIERLALDGFLNHNSLYLTKIIKTVRTDGVPFIVAIDAEYVNSHTVRLHVSENLAIGRIEKEGFYYYFDVSGVVLNVESSMLEKEEEAEAGAEALTADAFGRDEREQTGADTEFHPALTGFVPIIDGISDADLGEGRKIPVEDEGIFQTILSLTKLLDRFEMKPDLVHFADPDNVSLVFGNARVLLGDDSLLEEKMSRAAAILPQILAERLSGELHLESYTVGQQNIIFSRDEESMEGEEGDVTFDETYEEAYGGGE